MSACTSWKHRRETTCLDKGRHSHVLSRHDSNVNSRLVQEINIFSQSNSSLQVRQVRRSTIREESLFTNDSCPFRGREGEGLSVSTRVCVCVCALSFASSPPILLYHPHPHRQSLFQVRKGRVLIFLKGSEVNLFCTGVWREFLTNIPVDLIKGRLY